MHFSGGHIVVVLMAEANTVTLESSRGPRTPANLNRAEHIMEAIELEAAAEYLNVSPHVSCKQLISEMENPGLRVIEMGWLCGAAGTVDVPALIDHSF